MSVRSGFTDRVLRSFLVDRDPTRTGGHRERAGYGFGRRFLASFLRIDLPLREGCPDTPATSLAAARRPGSTWFALPTLRALTPNTVLAATSERIGAVRSPDDSVEFSVYRTAGEPIPDYTLEVVLRSPSELPALVRVSYPTEGQGQRTDLVIAVAAAPLGPPTGRVTLPGLVPGMEWESTGLVSPDEAAALGASVIMASIAAAANRATIEAWQQIRAGDDALAALVDGLSA